MGLSTLFQNQYFIAAISGFGGIVATLLVQQLLNRRALFTYFVRHSRIGLSTDDDVFGSVRVTWNENVVANLYHSSIELMNRSFRDYDNVVVRVFTTNTVLLSEKTEIAGTTQILYWTPDYQTELRVPPSTQPTASQWDLHGRSRDYLIPTMNRGQIVRLQFLNGAKTLDQPEIWLDILHKGVRLEFRVAPQEVFGVPVNLAAGCGIIVGLIFVASMVAYVSTIWIVALSSLSYGLVAQIPGALVIRIFRSIRNLYGG